MFAVAISFIFALVIGVPIAFVLGLTGLVHMSIIGGADILVNGPQKLITALDNFSLLAIPLFVLTGELMGFGGITERLFLFANDLVGHVKGGLAYVNIVVGIFLGAILGSANAAAALLGSVVYPELRKNNYDEVFSANLTAAVAILGPIIPPSMVFVVYGVAANISIGGMFIAGIIPGLLLATSYALVVAKEGRKADWPVRERASFEKLIESFKGASPALLIPFIILGGIIGGVATPTESAAVAAFAALIVGRFIYKRLKWSQIPEILEKSVRITTGIMIIVAMANILGWSLAIDQVPQKIAAFILSLSNNKYIILLLINILLLIVGCLMDTMAAIIILVPVITPIAQALGIDPLHFGMIVCINLIIGLLTPPVGVALFTTSAVTKVELSKLIGPIWKFVLVAIICLFIITYIPSVTLVLPRLLLK